jgi:predicted phosphodiesterase
MVKTCLKISLLFLMSGLFCLLSACNFDFLGLFYSSDLDERLAECDNFQFLNAGQRSLSLGNNYSFIVLTDTHIEDGDAFGLEGIKDVIAADSEIKFIVVLGDITQYGSRRDVSKFTEIFADIWNSHSVPCYPVIGNHDIYFNNWPIWKDHIGSTRYKITGGGTTLFILDSANAFFGMEQLNWLEREIKNTSGRVFVFTHSNLFEDNPFNIQQLSDVNERDRIMSILKNKCDIMFMGHTHERRENKAGDVKYINVDGFRDTKVYCLVSVTSAGVSYTFKKL